MADPNPRAFNWVLSPQSIPTGETRPIEQLIPNPSGNPLKGLRLDDVFMDLVRGSSGKATMFVQRKKERVEVAFGPNYKTAVAWAPGSDRPFICFEPMAGITDSMNLAHKDVYKELQYVQPGEKVAGKLLDQSRRILTVLRLMALSGGRIRARRARANSNRRGPSTAGVPKLLRLHTARNYLAASSLALTAPAI